MARQISSARTAIKAALLVAGFSLFAAGNAAHAAADRSGKAVYDATCAECHASGKDLAPKFGDAKAWSKRADKGLANVTAHAIEGVRKMPAHGGSAELTDLEISRAVAYMVSGGHSDDPNTPYSSPQRISGEQLVQQRCQECHADGKLGAPRIGDLKAWQPRLDKGVEALVKSSITGHKAMPARGGMNSLSDAEMRAAVVYMVNGLAKKSVAK